MSKISIIMPVYNSEKYLRKCLDSIVNQTFKDFELICVNDGSIDNSLNILKEYKNRYDFIKIVEQENQGSGAARNFGFSFVKSETVLFLDSDDYFYPEFLEKMYIKYEATNADIVICRYNVKLPDGSFNQKYSGIQLDLLPQKEVFNKNDMPTFIFNFINHAAWNKLIKTELIKKYGIKFDNILYSNDVFFTLSCIFYAEKITTINDVLIDYNFFNTNSITINRNKNLNIYIFDIFERLEKIVGENELLQISLYNAYLSAVMYALNFLRGDIRRKFLKLIKEKVPLKNKKSVHKKYMYYRLLLIKKLPITGYIFYYKLKCILKHIIFEI